MSQQKIIEKLHSLQNIVVSNVDSFKKRVRNLLFQIDNKELFVELLRGLSNRKGAAVIFSVLLEFVDDKWFNEITTKNSYFKRLVIDYTKDFIQERICQILLLDNDPDIREKARKILEMRAAAKRISK